MAVTFQDYYKTLGVGRNATREEIRRAYRKLARQYHPDVNAEPEAAETFRRIGEAYEVLKDPEKRRKYDQLGENWRQGQEFRPPPGWENVNVRFGQGNAGDLGGFSDFFRTVFGEFGGGDPFAFGGRTGFGAGRPRSRAFAHHGEDQEAEVELTLEEAAHGTRKSLEIQRQVMDPGGSLRPEGRSIQVTVPPGVTEGSRIRLAGQGGPGAGGGPAGDLYLRVRLRPDPRFRVSGHDLHATVDLAPWEAALGTEIPVATLDGTVKVRIPKGTSSGQTLRLKGKGLPRKRGSGGDLMVHVRIVVPTTLSPEERSHFEALARESSFRPRG